MRKAKVYRNGVLAGVLTENDDKKYIFRYDNDYFANKNKPAVSLTLPKNTQEYTSDYLFPFFFNMLSEGANRQLQCTQLKIDENDDFGLLLATATHDTVGAIILKPIK
ncbi:MAG: HipA N-terminal domain-containing protein [Prevotellaceae bacterium]|jgi:serine/threonine-protein kinase HipA|nr:HipA N-terminal domain-containing protein [Prevotellaceae bacterium]